MVLPTGIGLINWKVDQGAEMAEFISTSAKEYGHLFHLIVSMHEDPGNEYRFRFNDEWWYELAYELCRTAMLPRTEADKWCEQMVNDMAAYFNWKKQHEVRVLAVEVPLMVDDFMVATPGDMVAEMTIMVNDAKGKKKYPKRVVAGIDFKTSDKSASYPEYRLQLEFMRYAWNQHFKGTAYEMTEIFNWRPSPRSNKPGSFILTNQSGYFTKAQLVHLGRTNRIMKYNVPSGGVTTYFDTEDEGFNSKTVSPLIWLREWQESYRI